MATQDQQSRKITVEKVAKAGREVISNKQSRSVLFLILTILIVLALNSLLPLIEGGAHYTEMTTECTYAEYVSMHEKNSHYALTYTSKAKIELYKIDYIKDHPELTVEEKYNIAIPDNLNVNVYTKFFFQSTSWYLTTITHMISIILIFYSVFNYLLTKHKTTYKKYLDLDDEMTRIAYEHLDPVTFEPWMVIIFNRNRKIAQHKANTKYKLEKLERRTNYKVRLEYKNYIKELNKNNIDEDNNLIQSYITTPLSKKALKYKTKRDKLLSYLEDDYINNYVIDSKVKHFVYIQPAFVMCGVNTVGITTDTYSLLDSDNERLGKQAITRVLTIAGISITLALLTTLTVMSSREQSWMWIAINIVIKIVPLLYQIINAYDYRDNFMNNQLIPNLNARRTISFLYMADMKNEEKIKLLKE